MKHSNKAIAIILFTCLLFLASCSKTKETRSTYHNTPPSPPPTLTLADTCSNRPVITAQLVPFGLLSEGRIAMQSGAAGSKILFAGGIKQGRYSSRVDIYDTITKNWSTAELTIPERQGMAVATVGTRILFAGGEDADWGDLTSRVDIYDAVNNAWSTAELSQPRSYLAAATIGDKVFFAGGGFWGQTYFTGSAVVDIYNNSTKTWSTAQLSEGRYELSATSVGNKIYFAGGLHSIFNASDKIDVFDMDANTWSVSQLQQPRAGHAGFSFNNQIFWVGGASTSYWYGYNLIGHSEIRDLTTGNTSFLCVTPKSKFNIAFKGSKAVFFTGSMNGSGRSFEIYDTATGQWSTGVLPFSINDATVISVNNTIYVAGGRDRDQPSGPYYDQVWKLEF